MRAVAQTSFIMASFAETVPVAFQFPASAAVCLVTWSPSESATGSVRATHLGVALRPAGLANGWPRAMGSSGEMPGLSNALGLCSDMSRRSSLE
ncbi:hypothetical protein PF005_g13425 [Phytophthora fragariae]|uniref:Uncharacterized protein n=1 Tax=Phytophthora fragariae TaxID=53985 RepID=A0A6A3RW61_9STRA|nr:hypothetical protein PF009_g14734 [Phytophthora fragariae]KAE9105095.1 hypothetical protein PF010_g13141 [Phytophthora fragariae]KAE9105114.1 hypothetical protein PF007_g13810 [Phytophthora fragariae]KAE9142287.1 hypothetical protein PF006_g12584 [Phytophthora fragariae]KAE9205343.1 hypothetical protein PF005_g13425 [Phytophthora fragariae]